jgi:hypothetical protein
MSKTAVTKARKLVFPEDGEIADRHFDIVWTAFCLAFPSHAKGYEQLKLCNRIGAKLESISEEAPGQETAAVPKRDRTADTLLLEEREFEKLKAMVKSDDVPWTHRAGTRVEEVVEWLETSHATEAELKETKEDHGPDMGGC